MYVPPEPVPLLYYNIRRYLCRELRCSAYTLTFAFPRVARARRVNCRATSPCMNGMRSPSRVHITYIYDMIQCILYSVF